MNKRRLRVLFCDHLNLARSKYLPFTDASDGETRFCQGAYAVTYDKELIPAPGSKMLEGLPDMIACYQGKEIRQSWHEGDLVVVCDLLESDRTPLSVCGRTLLKRTVDEWKSLGFSPKVGIELEAFAFTQDESGEWIPYDTPGAFVYSTGPFTDPAGFTDEIWQRAHACGFRLEMITSEYDAPQFEFTLRYDDAVKAIDDSFLFRLLAREVAFEQGILLSFMPKPIAEVGGSGLHVNFSLNDAHDNNVIGDSSSEDFMSDIGRGCLAGLMQHHKGLAGLLAPTVNSYQRLQPASLSGYWCNWGVDHRGVTARISSETGPHARIEHRMADGAANPYVATAAILQAAKLGYESKYSLPPAETGDCLENQDATEGVSDSLAGALEDLAADASLVAAVGDTLVQNLIFTKKIEIEKLSALDASGQRDYYLHYI